MGKVKELWQQQREDEFNMMLEDGCAPAPYHTAKPNYANRTDAVQPIIVKTETINTGEEILTIDTNTGEIIVTGDPQDIEKIRTSKIKALSILKPSDFCMINGTYEPRRDGLIKILSSLPISYQWEIKTSELTASHAKTHGILTIQAGSITRQSDGIGLCEPQEMRGNKTKHIMMATSETRALKRAIETLFGGLINYYVIHYLDAA
jgi:hypothetical protein